MKPTTEYLYAIICTIIIAVLTIITVCVSMFEHVHACMCVRLCVNLSQAEEHYLLVAFNQGQVRSRCVHVCMHVHVTNIKNRSIGYYWHSKNN